MKKKLTAALIASLFATVTYAQAPGSTAPPPSNSASTNVGLAESPSATLGTTRSATEVHKHKVSHHRKKPFILDKANPDGKSSLQ
ncbi:hypothetical protein [Burkholderia pyrrocinia]|uniref:hypothetical protein n=1 Tax=Burkholderia pyrrocinia TaxID=60550 RepID=UPI001BD0A5E4|nr:hypothetical protein [Burkholderia pyrrocinia]QVN17338.1 hypothetical protein JYG32_13850 [Burkholderia pyrrocinia]